MAIPLLLITNIETFNKDKKLTRLVLNEHIENYFQVCFFTNNFPQMTNDFYLIEKVYLSISFQYYWPDKGREGRELVFKYLVSFFNAFILFIFFKFFS